MKSWCGQLWFPPCPLGCLYTSARAIISGGILPRIVWKWHTPELCCHVRSQDSLVSGMCEPLTVSTLFLTVLNSSFLKVTWLQQSQISPSLTLKQPGWELVVADIRPCLCSVALAFQGSWQDMIQLCQKQLLSFLQHGALRFSPFRPFLAPFVRDAMFVSLKSHRWEVSSFPPLSE